MKKDIKELYKQSEFNKHDKKQEELIKQLKQDIELAENEATVTVDGIYYPVSTTWREVASLALELADNSDWFDRYDELSNNN